MARYIAYARDAPAAECDGRRATHDDRPATDRVPNTRRDSAIDEQAGRGTSYSTFSVFRTLMTMTEKNDMTHWHLYLICMVPRNLHDPSGYQARVAGVENRGATLR
ncbi:hypothetical protein PPGU16_18280 [Paraburkholderia largidicola]|uniref:Uncharacterized protein n=1 Tax=Paraburkholderia largidicola TaxID=3014751 RepID=A0A7I8BKP6_9BURK|nr:hypothetical protein PPGU16_18280 [Paraburkholderia sp. PGU16]